MGVLDDKLNFIDFDGVSIEDELINRPDDAPFQLKHDTFYYDNFQIWTGEGQTGEQLQKDADYELLDRNRRLSEDQDATSDVFAKARIINSDYINQDLYASYTTLGDFTDFGDLQLLDEEIDNTNDRIDNLSANEVSFDDQQVSFTAEEAQTALQLLNESVNITFDDTNVSFASEEVQSALQLLNKSENITFDNANTVLDSEFVQQAIAEISGDADKIEFDDTDFFESQSTVQSAIQSLSSAGVVDEGSTEDGDYIRYENGWQVCIRKTTLDLTSSGSQTRDMPQSFVNDDSYATSIDVNAGLSDSIDREAAGSALSYFDGETDRWRCRCSGGGDKTAAPITLLAIGRWK